MPVADASPQPAAGARRPIVVELVGLPGAGKTTIAQAAIEELEAFGYLVAGRRMLGNRGRAEALASIAHRVRNPRVLWLALRAAFATAPMTRARIRHALRLADWAYRLTMPRLQRYDVIILDQGVVQEGWSVAVGSSHPAIARIVAAIQAVISGAPVPVALVHVELTPDAAGRRLAKRASGGSRFDGVAPAVAKRQLEEAARWLGPIAGGVVRDCHLAQLRLDARRPIEGTAADLVTFVRSLRQPPAAQAAAARPTSALDTAAASARRPAPEAVR